ncbi:MAG: hypothetical protein IJK53_10135 [Erysipelotrichaceae bacterium]|nr:hypothetical protein [Clostridia bacterium]MBQ6217727.1 hypothetical protein [Erysipelotrichaceae bacterium]
MIEKNESSNNVKSLNLYEYKHAVRCCIAEMFIETEADRLMKLYDEDLEMIYKSFEWSPATAAIAILFGY